MYALYTVLFLLVGFGLLPHVLWRCLRGATYHQDLAERCGYGIVPPTGSWLAVAAYGFMPPRWEKCKGCARSLPGCINACLSCPLCSLPLPRPVSRWHSAS